MRLSGNFHADSSKRTAAVVIKDSYSGMCMQEGTRPHPPYQADNLPDSRNTSFFRRKDEIWLYPD